MSEQLIPLSDEDRRVLTDKRRRALRLVAVFVTATLLLLSALVVFHTFLWVTIIITLSFTTGVPALIFLYALSWLSKDLRAGQKQMLRGPIEAQNVDVTRRTYDDGSEGDATYRFWIQIAGKKVTLSEDQYYQFKKGDIAVPFRTAAANCRRILTERKRETLGESEAAPAGSKKHRQRILAAVDGVTRVMKSGDVRMVIAVEVRDRNAEWIRRRGKIFPREVAMAISQQNRNGSSFEV